MTTTKPVDDAMPPIKPCPFCGEPEPRVTISLSGTYSALCFRCEATGPEKSTRGEAAAAWNTRVALASATAGQAAAQKYDDTLLPFLALMRRELHANSAKGDRPGWLKMDANTALLEVYWHAAKLSAAVKNNDGPAIMEHSADVANMAMMVADVCGVLVLAGEQE